ncbi:MAG: DUF4440 domain-containing protein [Acidobacteria bacterium]|nr:DUF4440 domain-containing protein [Acidobacteriota bacterium]
MKLRTLLLVLCVLGLSGACSREPAVNVAAEETAIRDADTAWSNAASAKQLEQTISYYAADASVHPPNAPMATGKESIRKFWEQLFNAPGSSIRWQPAKTVVAKSGDLAYSQGTYDLTMNDPQGNPVTDRGKYVVAWKKEGGAWKAAEDIFNSDLPPPPPAPAPAKPAK